MYAKIMYVCDNHCHVEMPEQDNHIVKYNHVEKSIRADHKKIKLIIIDVKNS